MTPEQAEIADSRIALGHQAKALSNTILGPYFEAKTQEIWAAFLNTKIGDAEELVRIHMMAKSMGLLRQEIQSVMDSGQLAKAAKEDDSE